ncbi:MAG: serine/threonine-protein phosphatase, partial [Actinomycetia bacterium]|nr:serine/threonine-protein phosphatase [Actinomycetes bacterium]
LLKTRSPVIGIFPSSRFKDEQVTMRHGDMLLLYTDGVIEARREGELYGEDRLVGLTRGSGTTRTKELPQRILEEVSGFCEGGLKDDLAILTISFLGTTPVQSKRAA